MLDAVRHSFIEDLVQDRVGERRRVTMFDILNGTQKIGEGRERRVWFDDGKGLLIKVGRLKD